MATLPCVQQTTQPSHVVQNEGIKERHVGIKEGSERIKEEHGGVKEGHMGSKRGLRVFQ